MPGAFKLDHLQPIKPLFLPYFCNFFTSIPGVTSYYPEVEEFIQPQNWMRQRGFGAWGIQTGPFAALCTSHFLKLFHHFHLLHFHTGRPILITPEGQYWEKGILPTPEKDETEDFQCLEHSKWTTYTLLLIFLLPTALRISTDVVRSGGDFRPLTPRTLDKFATALRCKSIPASLPPRLKNFIQVWRKILIFSRGQ